MGLFDQFTPVTPETIAAPQPGGFASRMTPVGEGQQTSFLSGFTPVEETASIDSRVYNFGAMNPNNPGEFLPSDEAPFDWIKVDNEAHPFHKQWLVETDQNLLGHSPIEDQGPATEGVLDAAASFLTPYFARHPEKALDYWGKKMDQIERMETDPLTLTGFSDRVFGAMDIAAKMLTGGELIDALGTSEAVKTGESFGRAGKSIADGAYYLTKTLNNYTIPGALGYDVVGDYITGPLKNLLDTSSSRMSEIAPSMERINFISEAANNGDWSKMFTTILNEPTGFAAEFAQMVGGQATAIMASAPAGLAGLGTSMGLMNLGDEVQTSIESGNYKSVDDAIEAGFMKAGVQTAGDLATGYFAKAVPLFKAAYADLASKALLGTSLGVGTLWGSRKIVGEETTAGELAISFGAGALFETPAILSAAGKFGTGADSLITRLDDPNLMGPPQTNDSHVTGVQRLLELMERKGKVESEINSGTLRTAMSLGLVDEGVKAKLDAIFKQEDARKVDENAPELSYEDQAFLHEQAKGNLALHLLQPETIDFLRMGEEGATFSSLVQELPVTLSASGKMDTKAASVKNLPLSGGQVVVSLNQSLLAEIRTKYEVVNQMRKELAPDAEIQAKLSEITALEQREALAIDTWRKIQTDLAPVLKAFDPKSAVVLTDNFSTGARRDEPGVAMFTDKTDSGMKRIVLGFDPANFFKMVGEKGKQTPVFDREHFVQTVSRQLARNELAQKHAKMDDSARAALGVAYQKYLADFAVDPNRGLSDELATRGSVGPDRNANRQPLDYADFAAMHMLRDPAKSADVLKKLGPVAEAAGITVPKLQDYMKVSQKLINERRRVAEGETDYTVSSPVEPSYLWQKLTTVTDGGVEVQVGDLKTTLKDKTLPIWERKAFARTLRQFDIDNPQADQNKVDFPVSRLAAAFDQNLRLEIAKREALKERALIGSLFESPAKAAAKLDAADQKFIDSALGSYADTRRATYRFVDILQLERLNPHIAPLRKFTQGIRDLGAWRYGHLYDSDVVAKRFRKLSGAQQLKVSEWMHHESKYGDTLAILRKNKLATADESALLAAGISKDQITKLKEQSENARTKHVKEVFGLSDEAYEAGMSMRRIWTRNLNQMEQGELTLLSERHSRKEINRPQLEQAAKRIKDRYTRMRKNPYVASMRFGDKLVRVVANEDMTIDGVDFKKGDTVSLSGYESKSEYDAAIKALDEEFGKTVKLERADTLKFDPSQYIGMPMSLFYLAREGLRKKGVPESQIAEIEQVVRSYAPDSSFSKRLMRKSHVAGASDDLARAFIVSNEQFANYFGKVFYGNRIQRHLDDLDTELRTNKAEIRDVASQQNHDRLIAVRQGMQDELDHILSSESPIGSKIKTGINLMYFGLVGRTAVANLAQGVAMYSDLAAKYGDANAAMALGKATANVLGRLTKLDSKPYTPLQEEIRTRLLREGVFSHTFIADMVDLSHRSLDYHISKQGRIKAFPKKMKDYGKSGWMLGKRAALAHLNLTDAWMREAQAMAAVELLEKKGGITDPQLVYKQVVDAIEGGSFKHEREYRPHYSRSAVMNTTMAFTNIIQKSVFTATRKADGAGPRFIIGTLLMGGLAGLFGAEDAMEAVDLARKGINKLTGNYGVVDTELEIRNLLLDHELPADFLLKGFSGRTMGLHDLGNMVGLNIPKVDMHASVSMGKLVPFNIMNSLNRATTARSATEVIGNFATGLAGPAGGIVQQGASAIVSGDWTKALPHGIQNMKYLNPDQREVDNSRGQPVYIVENDAERLALALGMRPPALEDAKDFTRARIERESYWRGMKTSFAHTYAAKLKEFYETPSYEEDAKKEIERELEALMGEMQKFNATVPHATYLVTPKAWQKALQTQFQAERRSLYNLSKAPASQPERAFPEIIFPELRGFDPENQRERVDQRIRDNPIR